MREAELLVERLDDEVTALTLNRPRRRNALTISLMESLCREFGRLADDPDCRVVVLRGAGPVFCSGLDLREAAELEVAQESAHHVARMLRVTSEAPQVTIAVVQGAAMAGGAGLMSCCDFVVAEQGARFGFPEVRRGLVAALATTVLIDRLGDAPLRELLLLGEPIDARRALEVGLIHRVVPADRLLTESLAIAEAARRGAPGAVRGTKTFLRELRQTRRERRFEHALQWHLEARASDEAREGMDAFIQKRDPRWRRAGEES